MEQGAPAKKLCPGESVESAEKSDVFPIFTHARLTGMSTRTPGLPLCAVTKCPSEQKGFKKQRGFFARLIAIEIFPSAPPKRSEAAIDFLLSICHNDVEDSNREVEKRWHQNEKQQLTLPSVSPVGPAPGYAPKGRSPSGRGASRKWRRRNALAAACAPGPAPQGALK